MKNIKFLLTFSIILLTVSMTATFVAAKQREHGSEKFLKKEEAKEEAKKEQETPKNEAQLHFFASSTEILPPLGIPAATSATTSPVSTTTPPTSTTTPPAATTTSPVATTTLPVSTTTPTTGTTTTATSTATTTKTATTTPVAASINNKVTDILSDGFFGSNYYVSSAFSSGATRSLAFVGVSAAILGVVLLWSGSLPKKIIRN